MGLFYKISDKELLEIRNKIFLERGIPALKKNGFKSSPFSGAWYGQYDRNIGGYSYEFCRLSQNLELEYIDTLIVRGDKWIKIFLNIFKLIPKIETLNQLQGLDGIKYDLPPNSLSKMRLRIDDYEGMPLFRTKDYKLKSFYSESGLKKRSKELGELIEQDLTNIDSFVKRWHELHKPNVVDWEGNKI